MVLLMLAPSCKKNKAPDIPSIPAGPTRGSINTKYTFASLAEDPDDDSITIRFDWGDEDTSNWSSFVPCGDSVLISHFWFNPGTYLITAQAQDVKEAVSSWSGGHQIIIGNPPNTPTTPVGDSVGSINIPYYFISTATDPDDDSVAIRFDWGDGDTSDWSDWETSEDSITLFHSWSDTGTYLIKAQAKDKGEATSSWSAGHSIKIKAGWIKTFGGSSNDGGCSVQLTSDGGYIITGYTGTYPNQDVYLIKTDASGNEIWYKTFGDSSDDVGNEIQQTTDGGYIISGHYRTGYNYDVYLIKTDASGNEIWHKTFGGSAQDYGHSVLQTTDGGYIITGYTNSFGAGNYDVYLIKTDANGNETWQKTLGGSESDRGYSVQQTTDGGYIITGYTRSFGAGNDDVYLIKTDANGNEIWHKTFGGSAQDYGHSVLQTTDGGYIITGYTGGYDVYLIKTDASGNETWQKAFGGSELDWGYSVQQTTDGGYIITGKTWSYGAGECDVYLIKTDASGNKLWYKTFGGSSEDWSYSLQLTTDGGYIITGSTRSYGSGESDVYLIKTDVDGNVE